MKYLFIGAHCDDIELSCGGTIAKLVEQGHEIHVEALSYCGDDTLLNEYRSSAKILGFVDYNSDFDVRCFNKQSELIADCLTSYKGYDFVFTHSEYCRHPDHRTVGQEAKRIFNCNLIRFMQAWNGSHTENYFIELTSEQLEKKISALWCYRSQAHRPYMSADFIRAQAVYNGIKCGKKYAEAFHVERYIQ